MKPVMALMTEHRLIERMLEVVQKEASKAKEKRKISPIFIDTTVDFIRTYADRTHHAKEEDILFREVAEKDMSKDDKALLHELIDDHNFARKTVKELLEAKLKNEDNGGHALETILEKLKVLDVFYREHIRKEDHIFFPACTGYLSGGEQEDMLEKFWESDRRMIHEKYTSLVEQFEEAPE